MRGLHAIFSSAFAGQGLVRASTAAAAPGAVVPTAPGPGDVFNEGANCTFSWTPDPSGTWKQTDVELMTGDNFNMVFITTVASFDGTDASQTTFSYPCPEVTPNSAIYFYQFSSPAATERQWTTRFAIADAQGQTTPPANATQPNAPAGSTPIPWGTGALKDPSKAVSAPDYLGVPSAGGAGASGSGTISASASVTANSTASATGSGSASASASVTSSSGSASASASVTAGESSSGAGTVTQTTAAPPTASTAGNGAAGNGTGNGSGDPNGAVGVRAGLGSAVLAVGVAAVGFVFAF